MINTNKILNCKSLIVFLSLSHVLYGRCHTNNKLVFHRRTNSIDKLKSLIRNGCIYFVFNNLKFNVVLDSFQCIEYLCGLDTHSSSYRLDWH